MAANIRAIATFLTLLLALPALANDTTHDWSAVGQLQVDGHRNCTATLIRDSVIVTAAQCVTDAAQNLRPTTDMQFHLFDRADNTTVTRGIGQVAVHPDYDPDLAVYHKNIAFLLLDSPFAHDQFPPMPYAHDSTPQDEVWMVTTAETAQVHEPHVSRCTYHRFYSDPRTMTCDTSQTSGGAPIVEIATGGEPRIVAIVVARGDIADVPVLIGTVIQYSAARLFRALQQDIGPARPGGVQRFHRVDSDRSIGARFAPAFRPSD